MLTRSLFLTLALSVAFLSGCAKLGNVKPILDVTLLEYEYENIRDSFRDLDLTVDERLKFEDSINLFEEVRNELYLAADGKFNASFLLEVVSAESMVDKTAEAFLDAEAVVISYHVRTGQEVPIEYLAYKSSAVDTYNLIVDRIDKNEAIPWDTVKSFLSLALRSYLTFQAAR